MESNYTTNCHEKIWQLAAKIVAHPHQVITPHDKHRATVLISLLSEDDEMFKYIHSQMNEDDFKQTKQIRASMHDKEITN
tara:strand:+ start:1868 stop:2107 length:240 start_codon:yes stop_codon:yes gene_type:complete